MKTISTGGLQYPRHASVGGLAVAGIAITGVAIGAAAVGAVAVGALAIGRLAIRRLLVEAGQFNSLKVEDLTVKRLHVSDSVKMPKC